MPALQKMGRSTHLSLHEQQPGGLLLHPAPSSNTSSRPLPSRPRSWFKSFAEAADQVGIPVCMSLAIVDTSTAEALVRTTVGANVQQ